MSLQAGINNLLRRCEHDHGQALQEKLTDMIHAVEAMEDSKSIIFACNWAAHRAPTMLATAMIAAGADPGIAVNHCEARRESIRSIDWQRGARSIRSADSVCWPVARSTSLAIARLTHQSFGRLVCWSFARLASRSIHQSAARSIHQSALIVRSAVGQPPAQLVARSAPSIE